MDTDPLTIVFAIQTEMSTRGRVPGAAGEATMDAVEADKKWKFVQDAHKVRNPSPLLRPLCLLL